MGLPLRGRGLLTGLVRLRLRDLLQLQDERRVTCGRCRSYVRPQYASCSSSSESRPWPRLRSWERWLCEGPGEGERERKRATLPRFGMGATRNGDSSRSANASLVVSMAPRGHPLSRTDRQPWVVRASRQLRKRETISGAHAQAAPPSSSPVAKSRTSKRSS